MLGRPGTSWLVEPIGGSKPVAATVGVWRVHAAGESLVLKVLHCGEGSERWPASPEESHPFYWRREAEAYASGLLARLAPPFRAVDCRACIERRDGTVALWLEDVPLPPASTWPLERYGATAFQLGLAQGELAASPPTDPWLSRRWLRAYVDLRAPIVAERGGGATYELWQRREEVLARIEAAPQTLNHLDFYPSNLFGDDHETVAIDWAYCGLAAAGEDAANLAPDSLLDGFLPPDAADELEALVWRSYLDGLRAGGYEPDERELRFVFVASVGIKYAWIEAAIRTGRAREGWAAVVPFLDRLAEEALELASSG